MIKSIYNIIRKVLSRGTKNRDSSFAANSFMSSESPCPYGMVRPEVANGRDGL
jgi:hypothetical protein